MDKNEIIGLLKEQCKLASILSEDVLEDIVEESQLETFEKGEYILEFEEKTPAVFILLRGSVRVSLISDDGKEKIFDHFHAGSLMGEVSTITRATAYATITAEDVCLALEIPIPVFKKKILSDIKAFNHLVEVMSNKLGKVIPGIEKHTSCQEKNDPYGFKLTTKTPQKILVINCGSSSLKYTFFNTEDMENSVDGQVDRIGTAVPMGLEYNAGKTEIERELEPGTHKDAFDAIIQILTSKEFGIISSPQEITAVGHRVVHGGDKFSHPTLITDDVLRGIEEVSSLAPLHNPVNLVGIHESMRVFPSAAQVAIFDTAFHQTIPPHAYLYGLPYEYYEKKRIRRYGFHGTSHYYVSLMAADYLKRSYTDLKLITCHLGNGGSVCAIEHGKSVDTSMGMTPAEGIIMGTRSGSIDPAVILHLMDSEKMTSGEVNQLINKQSGLLGLSGISNDMRDIEHAVKQGKNRAVLAYKTFCYSIKKYIGAYSATLGNVDALIFTGGIGLYNSFAREEVCKGLGALGMFIDQEKSKDLNGAKKVVDIATVDSPVRILVIPTNEELMIARETLSVICAD